jgi:hypothetical protein
MPMITPRGKVMVARNPTSPRIKFIDVLRIVDSKGIVLSTANKIKHVKSEPVGISSHLRPVLVFCFNLVGIRFYINNI